MSNERRSRRSRKKDDLNSTGQVLAVVAALMLAVVIFAMMGAPKQNNSALSSPQPDDDKTYVSAMEPKFEGVVKATGRTRITVIDQGVRTKLDSLGVNGYGTYDYNNGNPVMKFEPFDRAPLTIDREKTTIDEGDLWIGSWNTTQGVIALEPLPY